MKVVISGASSGIGQALARHYLDSGANVAVLARRLEPLVELAALYPGRVHTYAVDVCDADVVKHAAQDIFSRMGTPDLVIANAGVSHGTLTDRPEDALVFRQIYETNVLGMVHTFQPFIAAMRSARRGKLVGIASVAGFRGLPGSGAYSSSKAAAIAYLESLRVELHNSGVRVLTICPGYIRTPMTAVNRHPMPFMIEADDAARRMARIIRRNRSFSVTPWPMAMTSILFRLLPNFVYDRAFSRVPRKPRIHT